MKQLKHTFETPETFACNMKHTFATCIYSHCNIHNIQMKHLKTYVWNTWNTISSAATAYLVGNYSSQQAALGCRGRMAAAGQLGAMENAAPEESPWTTPHRRGELGGRSGSTTRWAETVVAGAGVPHANNTAAGPGAVARTASWSNRSAWKPSIVTSSIKVHRVELQCVQPWVGAERSSLSHTSCESSHNSPRGKPRNRSEAANGGVYALAISGTVQRGLAIVEKWDERIW